MRALRYYRTGPAADVLRFIDRPMPAPRPFEVRVRVAMSGVNPHDTKGRSGWTGAAVPEGGVTPHSDGAGTIDAVGASVGSHRIGERVWLVGARPEGTAAEYVCLPGDRAIRLPETLGFAEGAALGVPAITAWLAVLSDGPVTGQTILVQGGGGAVGRVAVELAARSGARVIATAGHVASRAAATEKGAHIVLDRHDDDVARIVQEVTDGRGVDRVIDVDFGANQQVTLAALAEHGTVSAYSCSENRTPTLDYYGFARKSARLDFVQGALLSPRQLSEASQAVNAFLEAGHLRPDIAEIVPWQDTALAHDMVEAGAPANVVVALDPAQATAPPNRETA